MFGHAPLLFSPISLRPTNEQRKQASMRPRIRDLALFLSFRLHTRHSGRAPEKDEGRALVSVACGVGEQGPAHPLGPPSFRAHAL